jgi:hypothetical protein
MPDLFSSSIVGGTDSGNSHAELEVALESSWAVSRGCQSDATRSVRDGTYGMENTPFSFLGLPDCQWALTDMVDELRPAWQMFDFAEFNADPLGLHWLGTAHFECLRISDRLRVSGA